jgi:putative transposase
MIAESYRVSTRRIYQILKYYRENGDIPHLKPCGRKPVPPDDAEIHLVIDYHKKYSLGAVGLEHVIQNETGIHIPHNRIHQILLRFGFAEVSPKKRARRKYCRYQRDHSTSRLHGKAVFHSSSDEESF